MFELKMTGASGTTHTIKRGRDGVVYCSCAAWRFQRVPAAARSCKHIVEATLVLGGQVMQARQ